MSDKNNKLKIIKTRFQKLFPKFSVHYFAYVFAFIFVVFSVVSFVSATTPNPGHPWSELGDGVFVFTNSQTVTPYTYTFPAANSTVLTTNAAVTVTQGGTGLSSVAAGSVLGYNALNTASAITSTTGTKVLTNTTGTITWETAPSSMVYPGSGIPNSTGSAWGTSYTTTGSGTVVALATTPTFITSITTPLVLGGTGTTQDLILQTTSGVGDTGADMHFLVGNNGATEAMTILNDGKVGVGTNNPGVQFDVYGVDPKVRVIESDGGTGWASFYPSGTLAANPRASFLVGSPSGDAITNAGFTVSPDISTAVQKTSFIEVRTNPVNSASEYRFALQQSTALASIVASSDSGATVGTPISIYTYGNTNQLYLGTTGNVGIGKTDPGNKLDVAGDVGLYTAAPTIKVGVDNTAAATMSIDMPYVTSQNATLRLFRLTNTSGASTGLTIHSADGTANTQAFISAKGNSYINTINGNFGVGVTVPTGAIHIKAGTATANTAPLKFTSGTNLTTAEAGAMEWDGTNLFITQTSGPTRKTIAYTSDITAQVYPGSGIPNSTGSSWGTSYTTTGSGTVLALATTPTFTTSITAPLVLGGTGTTQDLILQTTSGVGDTGADMHFLVGNNGATEAMTILNNGNVGIGTTAPTSLLALGGTAARTIQMERNTTAATAGQGLTLSSGGAIAGTADLTGGDLTLKSGISTGTGSSNIRFFTATAGTTGTTDRTPTEKMTILGSGSVGIGITNPTVQLHVYKNTTGGDVLAVEHSGVTGRIQFLEASTTRGYLGFGDSGNIFTGASTDSFSIRAEGDLHLGGTGNNLAMTIKSGSVGIGTTSPTAVLHLKAGTATASTAPLKFTSGTLLTTPEAGAIEFLTDAYYGTITTGGARKTFAFLESPAFTTPNIGVATATSLTSPTILGGTGTTQDLTLQTTSGVGATGADMHFLVGNNGATEAMTILNNGNVGIGNTNPSNKLDITNSIDNFGIARITNDNAGSSTLTGWGAYNDASTGYGVFGIGGTGYTVLSALQDRAFLLAGPNTKGINIYTEGSGSGAPIIFTPNDVEAMRIIDGGSVGIGTTAPTYRLDVKGTATADGIRSDMGFDIYQVPNPGTPTGVVSAGGSVDTGTHYYRVTYTTALGETNSTGSAVITTTAGNNTVTLTIPVSTDPRVTGRKLYRTKAGASEWVDYALATIANNTDVSYVDTVADSTLAGSSGVSYSRPNTTSNNITVNGTKSMIIDVNGTAFGLGTGAGITTGGRNVFMGYYAGNQATTTADTVAIGHRAGYGVMTGAGNSLLGSYAGYQITSGMYNTSMGYQSLYGLTTGSYNLAMGSSAGRYIANGSTANTTSDYSVYLGVSTKAGADNNQNEIVIGYNAIGNGSNTTTIGTGNVLYIGGAGITGKSARFTNSAGYCDIDPLTTALVCTSDINLKKNITTLKKENNEFLLNENITIPETTLEKILALNPVLYNWNTEDDTALKHIGLIAQEVEQLFPSVVMTDEKTGIKSIAYSNFIPYTIEAIKEMNLKLEDLSSLDVTSTTSLGSFIKNFLADVSNTITDLYASVIHSDRVETKTLCVGDTCVTEDQFIEMVRGRTIISDTNIDVEGEISNEEITTEEIVNDDLINLENIEDLETSKVLDEGIKEPTEPTSEEVVETEENISGDLSKETVIN